MQRGQHWTGFNWSTALPPRLWLFQFEKKLKKQKRGTFSRSSSRDPLQAEPSLIKYTASAWNKNNQRGLRWPERRRSFEKLREAGWLRRAVCEWVNNISNNRTWLQSGSRQPRRVEALLDLACHCDNSCSTDSTHDPSDKTQSVFSHRWLSFGSRSNLS